MVIEISIPYRLLHERNSSAGWELSDVILGEGEWGVELGTNRAKIGDGYSLWSDLPYFPSLDAYQINDKDTLQSQVFSISSLADLKAVTGPNSMNLLYEVVIGNSLEGLRPDIGSILMSRGFCVGDTVVERGTNKAYQLVNSDWTLDSSWISLTPDGAARLRGDWEAEKEFGKSQRFEISEELIADWVSPMGPLEIVENHDIQPEYEEENGADIVTVAVLPRTINPDAGAYTVDIPFRWKNAEPPTETYPPRREFSARVVYSTPISGQRSAILRVFDSNDIQVAYKYTTFYGTHGAYNLSAEVDIWDEVNQTPLDVLPDGEYTARIEVNQGANGGYEEGELLGVQYIEYHAPDITEYFKGDIVIHEETTYICNVESTTSEPDTNEDWAPLGGGGSGVPEGGTTGQVLKKTSDEDGAAEWQTIAEGREIELRNSGTEIQWRYAGEDEWVNLIPLEDISGTDGEAGKEVEFHYSGTNLQYRLVGDSTWIDLVPIEDITGPPGIPGRESSTVTTPSIGVNATWTGVVPLSKGYRLLSLETDTPCRVRLYGTPAQRDADINRPIGTDPVGYHGLFLDFVTTPSLLAASFAPLVEGASLETVPQFDIPISITKLNAGTGPVEVNFLYHITE